MSSHSGALSGMLIVLAQHWRRLLWCLLPFMLVYAGLLVLEGVAISRMDLWLPIGSMEEANRNAVFISSGGLWLRLCVIGTGACRAINALRDDQTAPVGARFLAFWCIVALALALPLLGVDLWRHELRAREEPMDGETLRGLWLLSIYAKIVLFYLAARLLFGAAQFGRGRLANWFATWTATTTLQSLGLFFALFVLMLIIDNVFVTVLSYMPVIAPFWFIPNELATHRYFVGQGTRIAAESVGILFYVAFWLALDRRV